MAKQVRMGRKDTVLSVGQLGSGSEHLPALQQECFGRGDKLQPVTMCLAHRCAAQRALARHCHVHSTDLCSLCGFRCSELLSPKTAVARTLVHMHKRESMYLLSPFLPHRENMKEHTFPSDRLCGLRCSACPV